MDFTRPRRKHLSWESEVPRDIVEYREQEQKSYFPTPLTWEELGLIDPTKLPQGKEPDSRKLAHIEKEITQLKGFTLFLQRKLNKHLDARTRFQY